MKESLGTVTMPKVELPKADPQAKHFAKSDPHHWAIHFAHGACIAAFLAFGWMQSEPWMRFSVAIMYTVVALMLHYWIHKGAREAAVSMDLYRKEITEMSAGINAIMHAMGEMDILVDQARNNWAFYTDDKFSVIYQRVYQRCERSFFSLTYMQAESWRKLKYRTNIMTLRDKANDGVVSQRLFVIDTPDEVERLRPTVTAHYVQDEGKSIPCKWIRRDDPRLLAIYAILPLPSGVKGVTINCTEKNCAVYFLDNDRQPTKGGMLNSNEEIVATINERLKALFAQADDFRL